MPSTPLKLFVCLGALLLFGLEPLVGRLLLPACGGGYQVWATCLMVFQGALFLGYVYCHLFAPRLGRGHLLVLALPLPIVAAFVWRGAEGLTPAASAPIASIVGWLAVWIVAPFAALASTGVVAQSWLARSDPGADPYRLYAVSNAGSLAALLGYPLLVEPWLGLTAQRALWGVGYLLYLGLALRVAPARTVPAERATPSAAPETPALGVGQVARWLALSAAPSALLMAVTNVIATDVGSAPFVWVVPLSLYLLSFVLVFGRRRFCPYALRRHWPELFLIATYVYVAEPASLWAGLLHLVVLFVACLVGHARLHAARPAASQLTAFYLLVALGGWLGGVFVSLVAPTAFDHLYEYPLSLLALALALVVGDGARIRSALGREGRLRSAASLLVAALAVLGLGQLYMSSRRTWIQARLRNHYGVYRVADTRDDRGRRRTLYHGTTEHGFETDGGGPVGYYHPNSGLGDVLRVRRDGPLRLGLIGLGTGTCAAYAGPGDDLVYYEIDPDLEGLVRAHFGYLGAAEARGAQVEVVPGDARLSLSAGRAVPAGGFDVLLVDAFSSDAIPTHLLTREALAGLLARLAPDGWLVFHLSNRYYDLVPVVLRAADALGAPSAVKVRRVDLAAPTFENPTTYVALRAESGSLAPLLSRPGWATPSPPGGVAWTDDYANLLGPLGAGLRRRLRAWWDQQ